MVEEKLAILSNDPVILHRVTITPEMHMWLAAVVTFV